MPLHGVLFSRTRHDCQERNEIHHGALTLDRRADRLIDAFSESEDIPPAYLRRSLARLEQGRQRLLEAQRREKKRVAVPVTLDFPTLSFVGKKLVAGQFIRGIDVSEDGAEIIWNI